MTEEGSMAELLMAKHGAVGVSDSVGSSSVSEISNGSSDATQPDHQPAPETVKPKTKFDINSIKSFPTLSNGPVAAKSPSSWGPGAASGVSSPIVAPASPSVAAAVETKGSSDYASINRVKSSVITENFTLAANRQVPNTRSVLIRTIEKAKRFSGASIDSSTNRMGHTTFILRGKPDQVQKARRELLRELSVKSTKTIQIPSDLRAVVIGTRGATLRPIIEKSGTNIKIDNTPQADDTEVDIIIEGDDDGIRIAVSEIMAIVSSRVREITAKIPIEDERYFPFLIAKSSLPAKQVADTLTITGQQEDVSNVRQELENYISRDLSKFTTVFVNDILTSKHTLLNLDAWFASTGVLAKGDNNRIELFGPKSKVDQVKKDIIKAANEQSVLSLDISKAHDKSTSHAENVLAYFAATDKLVPVEKAHNVQISVDKALCNIAGANKENIRTAKSAVVGIINKYGPGRVRVLTDVNTFFRKKIERIIAQQSTIGAFVTQNDQIVLVYEGPGKVNSSTQTNGHVSDDDDEDFAPGPQEITEALDSVNKSLDEVREMGKNLAERTFTVPKAEHKYILGPNGTTLRAIKGKAEDVIIEFGTPRAGSDDGIFVSGLKSEVDRIAKEIEEIVSDAKDYERLSNYTTEFKFPVPHVPKLIGKQGANLTKLREEYGVRIDIDEDGNGAIKGIKKNAEEAKLHIAALAKRMEDETTIKMKVPVEYHALLIGSGGKFVKRLRDKYNVRINFPDNGDKEDEIVIRGPSRGVEKTREEFADLVKYEQEHSYSETLKVAGKFLPRIIGRNGENINVIKDSSETKIDIHDDKQGGDSEIVVIGTKTGVKEAVTKINALVTDLSDIVDETIEVDQKYHALLIGPGGSTRREIMDKAGGSFDDSIDIPPAGSNSTTVKVHGHRKIVQKMIKQIKDIVDSREKQITEEVAVSPDQHGAVIGRGGLTKQDIEYEFSVTINIPKKGAKKSDGTIDEFIKVSGVDKANVEAAIAKIKELTLQEKVVVPKSVQDELANKGAFVRMLQSDYKVTVNVEGKYSSNGPLSVDAPAEAFGDDSTSGTDDSMKYKFSVYPLEEKEEKQGDITWRLKGDEENCIKARQLIEKTVEAIQKHDHRAYLWFADSTRYRFVIGPQGRTINRIRNNSGCTITVPNANSKEIIGLVGSKEQLEKAKQAILKAATSGK